MEPPIQPSILSAEKRPGPKLGLWGAGSANMLNMIGVGPFLSIPLALLAMHGSSVLLPWVLGALISLCDGLVWAELGTAMPRSGGPYFYVRQAFGPESWGRMASFLVLWSTVLTAPLLIASGAVGFAQYLQYLRPALAPSQLTLVAAAVCLVNVVLLYRRITAIGTLSIALWLLVVGTMLWIIVGGAPHLPASLHRQLQSPFPVLSRPFWGSVGAATLIAVYDYAGYYNVCLIGGELRSPRRTIPRAILGSIGIVAVLYIAMNLAILGVLPTEQAMHSEAIVAEFMQHSYGVTCARIADVLVLVAAFASVFAILLGMSRIPFVAARQGEFFPIFAREHRTGKFPTASLVILGALSACACALSLNTLISLVIAVQTLVQFLAQCVAVVLLRRKASQDSRNRDTVFRMPLYPIPVIVAFAGWLFVLGSSGVRNLCFALLTTVAGVVAFKITARSGHHVSMSAYE